MIPHSGQTTPAQHEILERRHPVSRDSRILVAVGMPVGTLRDPLIPSPNMSIRCSGEFHPVARTSFALWCAGRAPSPVSTVLHAGARQSGVSQEEVDASLGKLLEAGLLRQWRPKSRENRALLRSLRIVPTGVGLGSIPDDPGTCRIVRDLELDSGGGTAFVGGVMYSVWAASDGAISLEKAAREVVSALELDEETVWDSIEQDLPRLLAIRSCYLEVENHG